MAAEVDSNLERLQKDLGTGKGVPLQLKKEGSQQLHPTAEPHPPPVAMELRLGGGAHIDDASEDSDDQVEAMAEGGRVKSNKVATTVQCSL